MDYLALKHLHVGAAALSIALFVVRGAVVLARPAAVLPRWARIAPHVVDTVLLLAGIALAWQWATSALAGWLPAKIAALLAYIALGTIALRRGRTRRARMFAFAGAMVAFTYIATVALTKSPMGFVSLLSIRP